MTMAGIIKFLCIQSKTIISLILGAYIILVVILNGSVYENHLPKIYFQVFIFLIGLFLGMNLMVLIIRYLNKPQDDLKEPAEERKD
jgi:uncharacterized membrane protein AbrB (regulator of aidB expression)